MKEIYKSDIQILSKRLKYFLIQLDITTGWITDKQNNNFFIFLTFSSDNFKLEKIKIEIRGQEPEDYLTVSTSDELFSVLTPEQREEILFDLDIFS